MFSKKEDFINEIQFKIGDRFYDTESVDLNSPADFIDLFKKRNDKNTWKGLNFLPIYYSLKSRLNTLGFKDTTSNFDLNSLNKSQKTDLLDFIKKEIGQPLLLKRPSIINLFVYLFPLFGILGSMLISTYLITVKDYSGWIYVSGLIGFGLSYFFFESTKTLRTVFSPSTILDYSKSFYVVNHKQLKNDYELKMLESFILEELELLYGKSFQLNDKLPD